MNRLWVRLALAFSLVTIVAVAVASLLATRQVDVDFRRYVARNQSDQGVVQALVAHWGTQGSWQGADAVIEAQQGGAGRGRRLGAPHNILADADGRIIYDGGATIGTTLTGDQLQASVPLEVDGRTVGYLYADLPGRVGLAAAEQTFLSQVNRALWQAGAIAAVLGMVLGVVIARGLSIPLSRLVTAARRLAAGNLSERVTPTGTQEMIEAGEAFNEMATDLERAERLRRNLVADIAHELRTPLTVMQGNLQAILDDVYPLEKAEIAQIYDETVLLNRLIQDLRQLAQADAGQLDLQLRAIDGAAVVKGVVANFTERAQAQSIALSVDIPPALPAVSADPDRLRQILANLLSNALRHTPPGGQVRVGVAVQEPFVRFTVRDNGAGIAAEHLPHLFDRFWRGEPSRARDQGGKGLGLAIVRQLVVAHGGQVGVESTPGQGSTFWFTLPSSHGAGRLATAN